MVDILAIRKNTDHSIHELLKSGDLFDLVLVQMKGGGARPPTLGDIRRLKAVRRRYGARDIVLFSWKKGEGCRFERLTRNGTWANSSALDIFGSR